MGVPRGACVDTESKKMVLRESEVICTSFIDERQRAGWRSVPGVRRNDTEGGLQLRLERDVHCFVLANFVFRPLAVVDVHARSVPLDDLAARISQRQLLVPHPAVGTVRSPDARFELEG